MIPHTEVAETKKTFVDGYHTATPIVIKYKKPGTERVFHSLQETMDNIAMVKRKREAIVACLHQRSGLEETVPLSHPVIYGVGLEGKVTYSEFQEWFVGAKTLSQLGGKIFSLPTSSLAALRDLFAANIAFWKKEGYSLDIVGSSIHSPPLIHRFIRHLLPLFYSDNIIVDGENTPRFIDLGKFDKRAKRDTKTTIRHNVQLLGSLVSIGLLEVTSRIREVIVLHGER